MKSPTTLIHSRFIRFLFGGGLATIIHISIFAFLVEFTFLEPVVASVPAFFSALFFSYFFHRRWTFESEGSLTGQFSKFSIVALAGLGLNTSITYTVVNICSLWYGFAIGLIVAFTPVVTYLLNRHWTFGVTEP